MCPLRLDSSIKVLGCFLALSVCGLSTPSASPPSVDAAPPELLVFAVEPAPEPASDPDAERVERVRRAFTQFQTGLAPFEIDTVSRAIVEESDRYGIEVDIVLAVIHTESGFSNFARSKVGALGLMQIMPATGEMLAEQLEIGWDGPETLFDPVVNVRMGTNYLAFLHTRYKNWDRALAAYNWGPGAIDRKIRRGSGVPAEYATKVMARLQSAIGR